MNRLAASRAVWNLLNKIDWSFALNIVAALVMGIVIGLERQWRQHPAGLRTNALVSLGAALFVSLSFLVPDERDKTRIASYVVSGLGFLGGGVILREGLNVKGLNTAATIWCSGAVGSLCGSGLVFHAAVGTGILLLAHLCLRPLSVAIDQRLKTAVNVDAFYRMRVICTRPEAPVVRTILLRHVNAHATMTVQGFTTSEIEKEDQAAVLVEIHSSMRNDRALEDLVNRINIEPGIIAVSWEKMP
jgi:putative Mg2+ transporter-C (MgtC) family protein